MTFGIIEDNDDVASSNAALLLPLVALASRGQLHGILAVIIALQQALKGELAAR